MTPLMPERLAELREIAEAVFEADAAEGQAAGEEAINAAIDASHDARDDFEYAFDPPQALALLDEIARLREATRKAVHLLDQAMGDTDPQGDTPLLLACQILNAALSGDTP